jgi:hypothetical protein
MCVNSSDGLEIDKSYMVKFNSNDLEFKLSNINNKIYNLDLDINGKLNKIKKTIIKEIIESKFV